MALRITCPHCETRHRLAEPYPPAGTEFQCTCGRVLAITYPPGLVERLRQRGARFQDDPEPAEEPPTTVAPPRAPPTADEDEPTVARSPEDIRRLVLGLGPSLPPEPTAPLQADLPPVPGPGDGAEDTSALEELRSAPLEPTERPPAPPPPAPRRRWGRLLLLGAAGLLLCGLVGAGALGIAFWRLGRDLPSIESLASYRPPTVTVVEDREGRVIGEIYEKRRYVVPIEDVPRHVVQAFVAAEDAAFFQHRGVDPLGILRAALRNLASRRMAQGASTITQQVARNFLLTSEKKISRKIKEMILATRIEEAFSKDHILYLYLNNIYLGSGAYGIEAASRIYFDKHVQDLTLAEAALLAGLPQRPSDYSPHRHWSKARARQEYVLGQMVDKGFITRAEADAALAEHVRIVDKPNPTRILAPYFTEQVRRHLVDTYGFDRVYNEGLRVRTTCDLDLQTAAQEAVVEGVRRMDERIGWRGPLDTLDEDAIAGWREQQEQELRKAERAERDPALRVPLPDRSVLHPGRTYEAVVLEVQPRHAVVGIGSHEAMVPLSWSTWMVEPDPKRSWRYRKLDDLTRRLARGQVVQVRLEALDSQEVEPLKGYGPALVGSFAAARFVQEPALQGALLAYDLETGEVVAMVGGVDIASSEFNRAVQARRQVGSTFKPIVYTAAIETGDFTPATMVLDAPLIFTDRAQERQWRPANYGEDYLGNITLRKALVLSRNVCTVRILEQLGIEPVYQMARRLGISSPINQDFSMGLGSSSLTMWEMARAYSAFATGGHLVQPWLLREVVDRDGNVLESHEPAPARQVLDPAVAGITRWLLTEVATHGTAARAASLGIHAAGKTGTTNDFRDAWFIGFTPGLLAATWVGYDEPRSMGLSSTGGRVALPIWMDFMKAAWPKERDRPWDPIPGVVWAPIDEATGRVAEGGRQMPFLPGTVPEGVAATEGQKTAEDLLTSEF